MRGRPDLLSVVRRVVPCLVLALSVALAGVLALPARAQTVPGTTPGDEGPVTVPTTAPALPSPTPTTSPATAPTDAPAQAGSPTPSSSDASAARRAALRPLQLGAAQERVERAEAALAEAEARVTAVRTRRVEAQAALEAARSVFATAVVATYKAGAPALDPSVDQQGKSRYLSATAASAQGSVFRAAAALEAARRAEDEESARLDAARRRLDAARSDLEDEQSRAEAGLTVLGPSLLSGDDLARWAEANARAGWAVAMSPGDLARLYVQEGAAEGVRGDVAFAQAILETGFFTSPLAARSNFAGIGACDSCATGNSYTDVVAGVRAQMQLLRTYATPGLTSADLAHPPVLDLPERSPVRGCCTYWTDLTGVWATSPTYDAKILSIYLRMAQDVLAAREPSTRTGA